MELKLDSPAGADSIKYSWPLLPSRENDIIETMRWACEDLPELKLPLEKNILQDYDLHDYRSMKRLCDRFNRTVYSIVNLAKGTSLPAQRFKKSPSRGLLRHILQQVYSEAVIDPEKLNQYKPFSPEVYGETSYDLINQMIDYLDIRPTDVFLDLGSGVGQVVLQMAAATPCRLCLGIEKAEVPCEYATVMSRQFQKWMRWYGKQFGQYQLIKGDFFAAEHKERVNCATIVFVNNLAFGPKVDHQLKEIFANYKDGVYIVSSRNFCPLNFRITDRNLSDLATICNVTEMPPLPSAVSWTGNPVSYYVHLMDRRKLEQYFEQRFKNSEFNQDNAPVNSDGVLTKQETSTDSGWSDTWSNYSEEILRRREMPIKTLTKAKTAKVRRERTPKALKDLMRGFKDQYMAMLKQMKKATYRNSIILQIKQQQEYNKTLLFRVTQIEKQIGMLKQEGVELIKSRMRELDIVETAEDLLVQSKAIVQYNKVLQEKCKHLEGEITNLEQHKSIIDTLNQ